jgi:hypothetical protein
MTLVNVSSSKTLKWNYGVTTFRTFRVEGECKPAATGSNWPCDDGKCCLSYVVNVTATSPQEVCRKLKQRNFIKTIKSVKVFKSPVFTSDTQPTSGHYDLIDVTPSVLSCADCCEFLADEDLFQRVRASSYAMYAYTHQMSGSMSLSSDDKRQYQYQMAGQITLSGGTTYQHRQSFFLAAMSGMVEVGGQTQTQTNHYFHEASGSMTLSSQTETNSSYRNYSHQMEGTVTVVGMTRLRYGAEASGSMSITGGTIVTQRFLHIGSGVVETSGIFSVISPNYYYQMTGLLDISGDTYTRSSNLGVIDFFMSADDEVEETGVLFSTIAATAFVPPSETISLPLCCPTRIPTLLQLRHNLGKMLPLSRFLKRNGLKLPGGDSGVISLQYRPKLGAWQGNVHLRGQSAEADGEETWDLLFDLSCTDFASGTYFAENVWQFSMIVRKKNLLSSQDYQSRLIVVFDQSTFCPSRVAFDKFHFSYNITSKSSTPSYFSKVVFHDEAGYFMASPDLRMAILNDCT